MHVTMCANHPQLYLFTTMFACAELNFSTHTSMVEGCTKLILQKQQVLGARVELPFPFSLKSPLYLQAVSSQLEVLQEQQVLGAEALLVPCWPDGGGCSTACMPSKERRT
eukprot:1148881-Pelagomonas_calceolata.AAC.3